MLLFDNTASLGGLISLKAAIYSIAAGVFLAIFAYWFLQNVVGKLVRRIAKRAVGEENAKTLDELSRNNWLYRYLLRDNSTLRRLISCVGDTLPRITDKEEGSVLDAIAEESKAEDKDEVKATLVEAQPEKKNPFKKQPPADFTRAKFYCTEENAKKALHRYPKKVSFLWVVLAFVLAVVIAVAATYFLPIILGLFNK